MDSEIQYAVFPGTVTLHDGSQKTWTALDLATAYGVQDTDYLTITNENQLPADPKARMKILVLVPRADDLYEDIMYTAEDDGEDVAYRPDWDPKQKYIQETPQPFEDPDQVDEEKLEDDY